MAVKIEIVRIQIDSRAESGGFAASEFTGSATAAITDPNGIIEIDVKFTKAQGLDAACTQVYRHLAEWASRVADDARRAVGS